MFTKEDIVQNLRAKGKNPGNEGYAAEIKNEILANFGLVEDSLTDESSTKLTNLSKNMAKECKAMWIGARDFDKMLALSKNKVGITLCFFLP